MNFVEKTRELKKLTFKSPEWVAQYMSIVKDIYKMEKLYVILNPKMIDYDFEVGLPYVTKRNDAVMTLLFTERKYAEEWIEKYSNGGSFIGVIDQSMYNDFFARCVLLKVNVSSINEGDDVFAMGNADMVNINNIPTQINIEIPDELKGKENLTLKDLNVDLPFFPVDGDLSSNEHVENMNLIDNIDVEVVALMKDNDVLVNNKIHIFLNSASIVNWQHKHKDIVSEYKFVNDTVGMLVYHAIKRENSKGLIIDGLAPFQLFADKNELNKIGDAICAFSVFSSYKKEKINVEQVRELLYSQEFFVCLNNNEEGCPYDTMIRNNDNKEFDAVQVYVSEENADKFNTAEHEIVKVRLSDIISNSKSKGVIFEPYSHYWVQLTPEDLAVK